MSSSTTKRERKFDDDDDDVIIIDSVAPSSSKSMKMDSFNAEKSDTSPSEEDDWFAILELQLDEDYDLEETNDNYFKRRNVPKVLITDIAKTNQGYYDYLSVRVRGRVVFDTGVKQCRNGELRRLGLADKSQRFNQIRLTAFKEFLSKLNGIKKGDVIEVENIRVKRRSKEFNQFDHPFEAYFLQGFSTTPKILPDSDDYPRDMRFSFKKLEYIKNMTQSESIDVLVRCVKDSQMCRRRNRFGHPVVVRLLTLVDNSDHSIQVPFWDPVATSTPNLVGSNIIIQGLKIHVIKATGRVVINILMCSDFIVNPQMQISVELTDWWVSKGSKIKFTEIEKVEKSPVSRYYDAMNYYLSLPLPRPTHASVAANFGIVRQSFTSFINSNGIYARNTPNPKGVAAIIDKYGITNNAGDIIPMSKLVAGTGISDEAVRKARSRAGISKQQLQSPPNKEEIMTKIQDHFAIKKMNPAQTLEKTLEGSGLKISTVRSAMSAAGFTKKQQQSPKQPVKVKKAADLYASLLHTSKKITMNEAARRINEEYGPPLITDMHIKNYRR